MRWLERRRNRQDLVVVGLLRTGHHSAPQMLDKVGGFFALYGALERLQDRGEVIGYWLYKAEGTPRRRMYRLTKREQTLDIRAELRKGRVP